MGYFIDNQKVIIHDFLILTPCTVLLYFSQKKKKKEVLKPPSTLEFFLLFIDLGEQKEELQK